MKRHNHWCWGEIKRLPRISFLFFLLSLSFNSLSSSQTFNKDCPPTHTQIISVNCTKGNKAKEVAVHVLISASSREWKLAWELTCIETKVYSFNNWNQSKGDHENQRPWEFVELGEDALELLTIWHKLPMLSHPPMLNHPRCSMGYNNTFYMTLFLAL